MIIEYISKDRELNTRLNRGYKFLKSQSHKFKNITSTSNTFVDYIMAVFYLDKMIEERKTWPYDLDYSSSSFVSAASYSCEGLQERIMEDFPMLMAKTMIKGLQDKIARADCDITILFDDKRVSALTGDPN